MEKEKAIKFIKMLLNHLKEKYICTFRCEFNSLTYTFLIEDTVFDTEENKEIYNQETQKIIEDFESAFPCIMLEFIGNKYKLKNPIFELL